MVGRRKSTSPRLSVRENFEETYSRLGPTLTETVDDQTGRNYAHSGAVAMTDDSRGVPSALLDSVRAVRREATAVATESMQRAAFVDDRIASMATVEADETPSDVVYTENKLRLRHYEPVTETQHEVPILIVYALINKPFILDLQADRSVVRRLLEAGHDVYLIDWGEPSRLDASLGLYDYVERYIGNCVECVCRRSERDAINLLGYCMGGTMATIYAARHPERVETLGLMATGLYFDDSGGILELWGDEKYYDPHEVADALGNVPAAFLAAGFAQMDPVSNYLTKYVHLWDRLENEDFVENFARMERWLSDGVDVAGDVYAQFVEEIYQENRLYRNELEIDGERVDITNIDMPVLQIVGQYDTLVPNEASLRFNDAVPVDVTVVQYPIGHVGLSMAASTHRDVWPEVAEWFFEHSGPPSLADVIGEGIEEVLGYDVETDVTAGGRDEVEIRIASEFGPVERAVVKRDAEAVRQFLEAALGVEIELAEQPDGVRISIRGADTTETTVVTDIDAAIVEEITEAIEDIDIAAAQELTDVEGIGPTYAGRLRDAGIGRLTALAAATPKTVADAADATDTQAERWIASARELLERGGASGDVGLALERVDGIGPTYAGRLRQAGVRRLSDLAEADATAVAEAADVSVDVASDWTEQAAAVKRYDRG